MMTRLRNVPVLGIGCGEFCAFFRGEQVADDGGTMLVEVAREAGPVLAGDTLCNGRGQGVAHRAPSFFSKARLRCTPQR